MRTLVLGGLAALTLPAWSAGSPPQLTPATPGALVGTCEALATRLDGLPATTITSATTIAAGTLLVAGQPVPAHCLVTGRTLERASPVDGKTYWIGWEMRLPLAWNGRFYHQGNGGIDGVVATAIGATGGGPRTHALAQGFAVLSSNAGHDNATHGGPAFGFDPQARLDYGYQAVGTLTPIAKEAIARAYGRGPDRSYFGGCSNGGRHALVTAARYAQDYDGILAGAPGYNLPLAALANIWSAQRYATVATGDPLTPTGLETGFTLAERKTVAAAVLARCDALDGASDGIVQATNLCQRRFDLARDVPTCTGERDGTCLTEAQKAAIDPIFNGGARTSDGTPFYASFPYDPGLGGGGTAFWEFTAPLNLDSGAVGVIFKVPPTSAALTGGPAFAMGLDVDQALQALYATNETYTESAMQFMTPPDATDLDALRSRGGKVLVYHGVADPIFSVLDTEAWWKGVRRNTRGPVDDFVRLYRVPGMGHCSGGPSTDQVDYLSPLVAWVEQGQAPGRLEASARGAGNPGGVNADLPADWSPTRTRPLCPYPGIARYVGGDIESAASFSCTRSE
ncbi:MAG: tannase/feruloyl esterase family alpha/beta hydrolase [Rubrivivax sp.]